MTKEANMKKIKITLLVFTIPGVERNVFGLY
jgi:hypothetical protein